MENFRRHNSLSIVDFEIIKIKEIPLQDQFIIQSAIEIRQYLDSVHRIEQIFTLRIDVDAELLALTSHTFFEIGNRQW